jgi:hypothetical protein
MIMWVLPQSQSRSDNPNQLPHVRHLRDVNAVARHMDADRRLLAPSLQAMLGAPDRRPKPLAGRTPRLLVVALTAP